MKLRDMMFLVIGGLLVISGMVLNTLLSGDAEAQRGVEKVGMFKGLVVGTAGITIVDDGYNPRSFLGLDTNNDAKFEMYGDDGKTQVAYLGTNAGDPNREMMFVLQSKSKTDKRNATVTINKNGGRFESSNKMGENVVAIGVMNDGSDIIGTYDRFGNVGEGLIGSKK